MPTILRIGPYRFHFYSREDNEPAHIHIERDDLECNEARQCGDGKSKICPERSGG